MEVTIKKGNMVRVIGRKVSDKVQPQVRLHHLYQLAKDSEVKADGSVEYVVKHPTRKGSTMTINSKRFDVMFYDYAHLKAVEDLRKKDEEEKKQKELRQEIRDEVVRLDAVFREKVDEEELAMMVFIPLVVTEIAFLYAEKCMDYCRDRRMDKYKKVGRQIKEIREAYIADIRKSLNLATFEDMHRQAMEFYNECSYDFMLMEFQASSFIMKYNRDAEDLEMKRNALIGREMVSFFYEFNKAQDARIGEVFGVSGFSDIRYSSQDALTKAFDVYLEDIAGIEDRSVFADFDRAFKVMKNRLETSEFHPESK